MTAALALPDSGGALPQNDADVFAVLDAEDEGLRPTPVDNEGLARVRADRYLRALMGIERHIAAAKAEYATYTAHLALIHEQRMAPLQRATVWIRAQLADLFRFIPTGKAKSVRLLAGTIGTRHHAARLSVTDPAAVLTWAAVTGREGAFSRVVTETVPDRKALEAYALATGEVPDGCELVPAADDFYTRADAAQD